MIKITVFVQICLLDKLKDIIVADNNVQVLIEYIFDLINSYQSFFLSVKKGKHIQSLFFSPSSEEPFFSDQIYNFRQWKTIFVLMSGGDLIFDFFSVHLSKCEVSKNASKILAIDISSVSWIIEWKGVFDLIFLI